MTTGQADQLRDDVRVALQARAELGDELEPAVVDAFVARIEQRIVERQGEDRQALQRKRDHEKEMVLGAMGISVPLFFAAAIFTGLPGVIAVCVTLAIVAIASTRS